MGRGIAILFHDRGIRRWWVVSSTPRPHFTLGKDPVPILHEAGWATGPVWTGGKSRPHPDSILDRQARSQTEIITTNISWGVTAVGAEGWKPYHLHVPIVLKSGSLNLLKPSGPVLACNGIALPFTFYNWKQSFPQYIFSIYPTAVTSTTRTTLYSETSDNSNNIRCTNPKSIIISCRKVQIRGDAYLHTAGPYCRTVTWTLKRLWSYNLSATEVN